MIRIDSEGLLFSPLITDTAKEYIRLARQLKTNLYDTETAELIHEYENFFCSEHLAYCGIDGKYYLGRIKHRLAHDGIDVDQILKRIDGLNGVKGG